MILNIKGEVLQNFSSVNFSLHDNTITITTSDNNECIGSDYENHIKETKYKISGTELIEFNN